MSLQVDGVPSGANWILEGALIDLCSVSADGDCHVLASEEAGALAASDEELTILVNLSLELLAARGDGYLYILDSLAGGHVPHDEAHVD